MGRDEPLRPSVTLAPEARETGGKRRPGIPDPCITSMRTVVGFDVDVGVIFSAVQADAVYLALPGSAPPVLCIDLDRDRLYWVGSRAEALAFYRGEFHDGT